MERLILKKLLDWKNSPYRKPLILKGVRQQCSMHFIRYDVLYAYVLNRLQFWAALAATDEQKLLEHLLQNSENNRASYRKQF